MATINGNDLYAGTVSAMAEGGPTAAPVAPTTAQMANQGGSAVGQKQSLTAVSWAWIALVAIGIVPRVLYDLGD